MKIELFASDDTENGTITRQWYRIHGETCGVTRVDGEVYAVTSDGSVLDVDGVPLNPDDAQRIRNLIDTHTVTKQLTVRIQVRHAVQTGDTLTMLPAVSGLDANPEFPHALQVIGALPHNSFLVLERYDVEKLRAWCDCQLQQPA